jgi:hypothetical protein
MDREVKRRIDLCSRADDVEWEECSGALVERLMLDGEAD